MNKIYKVIWHASLGIWVVVSELSKGKTKTKCKKNEIKKSNKNNKCFVKNISIIFTLSSIFLCTQSIFAVRTITTTGSGNAIVTSGSTAIDGNASLVSWENPHNSLITTGLSVGESVVIGNESKGTNESAIILGSKSSSVGYANIIVGMNSTILGGNNVIVMGTRSSGSGHGTIVIGRDSIANGVFSLALGSVSSAINSKAMAIGHSAVASGINSIAFGGSTGTETSYNTTGAQSSGDYTIAIGTSSISSGENSIAFGKVAKSSGLNTIAIGYLTNASADASVAIGWSASSTGTRGIAIGSSSKVTGDYGIAFGRFANALAERSIVIGDSANVSGANSIALGTGSNTSGANSIALGASALANTIGTVAIGLEANSSGANSISLGTKALTNGVGATAIGLIANASSANSIAFGTSALTSAIDSISIGFESSATAEGAIALGRRAKAANTYTTAVGPSANASGDRSVAIGSSASANGTYSISVGRQANASANNTIVIGNEAQATKAQAIAIGSGAKTLTNAVAVTSVNQNGLVFDGFAGGVKSIGMQVSVGSAGDERQIKSVAAGEISVSSTDAINGSQLFATNNILGNTTTGLKALLGTTATLANNGVITMTNIGNTGKTTIHEAIIASQNKVKDGNNIIITPVIKDDGSTSYTVGTQADVNFNQVVVGTVQISSTGIDAGSLKITNVTDGQIVANSKEAINGGQLFTTNQNVAPNTADIATNKASIATNTANIATNTADIVSNKADIATNKAGIDTNAAAITTLNNHLDAGTLGLVQLSSDGQTLILSDQAKDTTAFDLAGKKIIGVEDGQIVANSKEAVNGGQLFTVKSTLETAIGEAGNSTKGAINNLASSLSESIGAGANYDSDKGVWTTPSFSVSRNPNDSTKIEVNSVGEAFTLLDEAVNQGLMFKDGANNTSVHRLGSEFSIFGDENISTEVSTGQVQIKLNPVLTGLTSITMQDGISISNTGINAGNKKITQVADGMSDTDATNLKQVQMLIADSSSGILDLGFGLQAEDGNNLTKKLGGSIEIVGDGKNIATAIKDNKLAISLTNDLTLNSIQVGDAILNSSGLMIGNTSINTGGIFIIGGPSISATGIDLGNKIISNVADGQVASDAVNKGQLDSVVNTIKDNLTDLSTGAVQYDKNGDGSINKNALTLSGTNGTAIKNVADGQIVSGSKDAVNGGQLANVQDNLQSQITQNTNHITEIKNELNSGGFGLVQQDGSQGDITVAKNSGGQNVNVAGTAGNRSISGVKDGVIAKDSHEAITGNQLQQTYEHVTASLGGGAKFENGTWTAPSYTVGQGESQETVYDVGSAIRALNNVDNALNSRVDQLSTQLEEVFKSTHQRIEEVEKDMKAGIAASIAIGSLPQPSLPGKNMVSAAASTHRGEQAIAVGWSGITPNQKYIYKVGAGTDSQSSFSGSVSVGFQW